MVKLVSLCIILFKVKNALTALSEDLLYVDISHFLCESIIHFALYSCTHFFCYCLHAIFFTIFSLFYFM